MVSEYEMKKLEEAAKIIIGVIERSRVREEGIENRVRQFKLMKGNGESASRYPRDNMPMVCNKKMAEISSPPRDW